MLFLKRLFVFYINSSIHVALAVCSLTWITLLSLNLPLDNNLLFFIFFASITGYNFIKYFELAKFHHGRLERWLKQIQIFSLFCFIALVYLIFQLKFKTLLYFGLFGIITFLYAIPFLPKKLLFDSSKNLRAISGLKIYIIAFVWAGITVIIPLVNIGQTVNADIILIFTQRFIYIIVATLPFEIRDMQFDNLKLATIPQKTGVKLTKIIGAFLMVLFFLIEFLKDKTSHKEVLITFMVSVLTILFLLFSKIEQSKYYSSFWLEGLPILWLLLMLF